MGMTMSQKILAAHAGVPSVTAGELVMAKLDLVLGHDLTAPIAIQEYRKSGCGEVFDCQKIALVMDHFVPNKDIKAAEQAKLCRDFAKEKSIGHFYDVGETGVEHVLIPEKGLVTAGDLVIGADSHTCTYGAIGAFSTGVGSTDMAAGMAYGKAWLKVPSAVKFVLSGKPQKWVSGKDIILHIIGSIGVDGALYQSMEFSGEGVSHLTVDDRFTICNMAIEAGAKNGIFPVDESALSYIKTHGGKTPVIYAADDDAEYTAVYHIDLTAIRPTVAFPHLPSNTKTFDQIGRVDIDQVVIGSCTNGRYSDFLAAAEILKGRKVKRTVRTLIIPTTQKIYLELIENGLAKIFVEAGCVVTAPTCGPCLGGHTGILAKGERCLSTTNRNFVGRMGHPESEVYLCNPVVAATSAVLGYIAEPCQLEAEPLNNH